MYVDDQKVFEDLSSMFAMGFTGKYGGKGFLLNPAGIVNDGYIDLMIVSKKLGILEFPHFMDLALKKGGAHAYERGAHFYRGTSFKIVNKNNNDNNQVKTHCFNVDGEDL